MSDMLQSRNETDKQDWSQRQSEHWSLTKVTVDLPGPNDKEVKMGSQVERSTYLYNRRLFEGEMLLEDREE